MVSGHVLADRRERAQASRFVERQRDLAQRPRRGVAKAGQERFEIAARDAVGQHPEQRQQATRRLGHARALDRELERGREVEQAVVARPALQHLRALGLPALPDAREVRLGLGGIGHELDRERHAVERGQQVGEMRIGRMSVAGDREEDALRVLATERLDLDRLAPGDPVRPDFRCAASP